jgi:hypothetical protein
LVLLTDLFDIKKLNQGHVSDFNSDELIRQCLIALLFAETTIKQDLVDVIVPTADGNSFRIIDMDGPMEELKKTDLEGPKVIPANIFHQATRLYRWPPAQKTRPSATLEPAGLTTGISSSEAGPVDSGSPMQTAAAAPRAETPPMQQQPLANAITSAEPMRTSSLPITGLLSAD